MKNSLRNSIYNSVGYVFPIVVTLATLPYIVHKLSVVVYGIYVLAISLTGSLSFLDLGFGQGIIKFIAHYDAKKDYHKINKIVGVSLLLYICMGGVAAVLIFVCADFLSRTAFNIPPHYIYLASSAFKLVSIGIFFEIVSGVFLNIPRALQRFDVFVKVQNALWLGATLSVVVVLALGHGLVAALGAYYVFKIIRLPVFYIASKKLLPFLRVAIGFDRPVFQEIFGFSAYTAINDVMSVVVFKLDKVLVGAFLGVEMLPFYQIPLTIVQMTSGFLNSVSQFLFPAVSYVNSLVDTDRLRRIYIRSSRYVIACSIVLTSGLLFVGDTFLAVWMGPDFAAQAASIIPILAFIFFFHAITSVGLSFYKGLGLAHVNMFSSLVGGLSYLGCAVFCIPRWGLIGAAIALSATLIPFPIYCGLLNRFVHVSNRWFFGFVFKASSALLGLFWVTLLVKAPQTVPSFLLIGTIAVLVSIAISFFTGILSRDDIVDLRNRFKTLRAEA